MHDIPAVREGRRSTPILDSSKFTPRLNTLPLTHSSFFFFCDTQGDLRLGRFVHVYKEAVLIAKDALWESRNNVSLKCNALILGGCYIIADDIQVICWRKKQKKTSHAKMDSIDTALQGAAVTTWTIFILEHIFFVSKLVSSNLFTITGYVPN